MKKIILNWKICLYTLFLTYGYCNLNAQISNVETFSKLYGYVRWFYPGDEASQIDWNKFAVYGVQKVTKAKDEIELKQILIELFKPIVPSLQINSSLVTNIFERQSIVPKDTFGLKPISWIHYGVGLGNKKNIYRSNRMNRDTLENLFGISYSFDISRYKGQVFKLSTFIKSRKLTNDFAYVLLTSLKDEQTYDDESVILGTTTIKKSVQWKKIEKTIKPDSSHNYLLFGFGSCADSETLFDSITLHVKKNNTWESVNISNDMDKWWTYNFLFHVTLDSLNSYPQKISATIEPSNIIPNIGEYLKKDIGNNLTCIIPIVLFGDKSNTYPIADEKSLSQLKNHLSLISDSSLNSRNSAVRIANVIIAWNVIQHFYPYFDFVYIDWKKVLTQTVQLAYKDSTDEGFFINLSKMIAHLNDGHGRIIKSELKQWGLPFAVDLVENKIVIVASTFPDFLVGDVIKSIDGKPAFEELLYKESLVSGSPQLKRYRALNLFSSDFVPSVATLIIIRNGQEKELKSKRYWEYNLLSNSNRAKTYKKVIDCGDSIFYLNGHLEDFNSILHIIKDAKGLIIGKDFDKEWELTAHVIKDTLWRARCYVPVTAYPDREKIIYDSTRWKQYPEAPYIRAKLAFLTYPSIVSNGESVMSIIDYYKLGFLVGDTTGGVNGNANKIDLMDGYSITWTGSKVLKHDGSQLHLIGFKPNYPVIKTIEAVKENRDVYLEKAKEILLEKVENP